MNVEQARVQWEKAAPGWAKWENVISDGAYLATDKMLEMAHVSNGKRVLDLASGAGSQTLIAAERVGPDGHVVANDISPTMLNHVKQNAESKGFSNVSTLLGAVQELEIAPSSFDSVICRLGLMLFPNPGSVLANISKALKPNGKIGVVVLSTPDVNPFFVQPMQILLRHAGKTPPSGAPGLFSLAAPGILEKLFEDNGFTNAAVHKQTIHFKMPAAEETLLMIQEAFGAYRAVISDSPASVQKAAWAEVLDYLKSLGNGQGIEAPSEVLVGSAQKVD
ncbi:MAG TPA: class I SAM-dependent methyltransferase [Sunxiuqinia sp.]|nr:class I SAM-dependent methyltransferase [Sunxiuqinia sp.]